ncbi:MAG: FtsX-like permease family protein [Candidatus Nomurabacteria bacterium]|nr:FtsX-like permease family protein [Candidatus Nomurabacteria bacterium]
MIKITDMVTLASTKLRTHRIWTIVFVVVEVLLVTTILTSVAVMRGVEKSLADFGSEGVNGRYMVEAINWRHGSGLENDRKVWDRAEELYEKYTAEHAAMARELGVDYFKDSEEVPTEYIDGERFFNSWTKYGRMALDEARNEAVPASGLPELEKLAEGYDVKQIFEISVKPASGSVRYLENGKEDLAKLARPNSSEQESLFGGVTVLADELMEYYLFPEYQYDDRNIPILMSYESMEKYLELEALPGDAGDEEKLERSRYLEDAARGRVISTCYRNNASRQGVFNAVAIMDEISRNKDNEGYVEPELVYDLPEMPCGAVGVAKDGRSEEQKKQAGLMEEYQKRIGEYEAPEQRIVKFEVIGLVHEVDRGVDLSSQNLWDILRSMTGAAIPSPAIPLSYYAENQEMIDGIFHTDYEDFLGFNEYYAVEFYDAGVAREFLAKESCVVDQNEGCATEEKPFLLAAWGNNSIAIDQIVSIGLRIIMCAIAVLVVFTMVSMGKTVARAIADDRREMAIFRAIGFERSSIMAIYLVYAILIGLIVVILAVVLTVIVGAGANVFFSERVTVFLQASFLTIDPTIRATVFLADGWIFVGILGLVLGVAVISSLVPIWVNMRRDLVKELKTE